MSGLLLGGCGMCHLMTAGHAHILFVSWRSFCVPTGLSPACDLSLAMSHLSTDLHYRLRASARSLEPHSHAQNCRGVSALTQLCAVSPLEFLKR